MHKSFDDRTFYHHAQYLSELENKVFIYSTRDNESDIYNNIKIISNDIHELSIFIQIKTLYKLTKEIKPQIIVCDSPISVFASFRYRLESNCKIIYDITEWIPSKKNITNVKFIKKFIKIIVLFFTNQLASLISTKLMFGEYYKSLPFVYLFFKPHKIISYYPDIKYINFSPYCVPKKQLNLLYSGNFNEEKGFDKVLELSEQLAHLHPDKTICLKLIGDFVCEQDKQLFLKFEKQKKDNLQVSVSSFKSFIEFCNEISDTHIFIDLRKNDFENTHCLPIKLFYYMACGRPVVYSALKAIKKTIDINNFGYIGEPTEIDYFALKISEYFNKPQLYTTHCQKALELSHEQFCWDKIKQEFKDFILN